MFDNFRKRVQIEGTTEKDRYINTSRESFQELLQYSPNVHTIELTIPDGEPHEDACIINDMLNLDDSTADDKIALFKHDSKVEAGSLMKWRDKYWLCVVKEENSFNSNISCRFRPCNHLVKWVDEQGQLHQLHGVITNRTLYSDGVRETITTTLPNQKMNILMPFNKVAKKVNRDIRIALFRDVYKVTNVDHTHEGYLSLITTEANISEGDDMINLIADAHKIREFAIEIHNNPLVNILDTLKIEASVIDMEINKPINGPVLYYLSDNEEIAKIDSDGLITPISKGTCNITVKTDYMEKIFELEVTSDIVTPTRVLNFNVDDTIRKSLTEEYIVEILEDGKTLDWDLVFKLKDLGGNEFENQGSGSNDTIAEIVEIKKNSCVVRVNRLANVGDKFIFSAESEDGTLTKSKIVTIIGLFD